MFLRTVVVAVVSNELLQGKDELSLSTYFLLNELSLMGYETKKISVLPADEKSIRIEIQALSELYDIVIVVEKLESNHVYPALASVFHCERELHARFMDCLNLRNNSWITLAQKDLFLPLAAKILAKDTIYPVVFLQRIFLLKSEFVTEQFNKVLRDHLLNYRKEKMAKKCLVLEKNSSLPPLEKLHAKGNEICLIYDEGTGDATLEVISPKLELLNMFVDEFREKYTNAVIKMYVPPLDSFAVSADDDYLIKSAIHDISKCFATYGPENVFMAFNGGKDCTVLLHLMNSVLRTNYPNLNRPIHCLYVQSEHPFPEQDEFLTQCQKYFDLKVRTVQSGIKDALAEMLKENNNLKACLMGTRRTDPYSENLTVFQTKLNFAEEDEQLINLLKHIQLLDLKIGYYKDQHAKDNIWMTDPDWPQVMRVNPLLSWHHSDIWDYLLYYKVHYCKLYDEGYTSLGSVNNTSKNLSLLYYDPHEDIEVHLPAYKLLNELKERRGRI